MKYLTQLPLFCITFAVFGSASAMAAHHEHGNAPQAGHNRSSGMEMKHDHSHMKSGDDLTTLIAVLTPTENSSASGTVKFEAVDNDRVKVTAHLTGLNPNSEHAIHVHEFGDIRAEEDGKAAGSHYNPEGHPHALPKEDERHAGDFGNLSADSDGEAEFTITVDNISLNGHKNPVLGRAVIVHAKADDGGQPSGNAGARIAQGVIGVMNPEYAE